MMRTASITLASLLVASMLAVSVSANAQRYPARPIRLIVAHPPGGQSDALGRIVAERFSEILKQPVVVVNRDGAGGTIGAEEVARSPADGYTLLIAGANNLSLASLLMKDLRYRLDDFAPVGTIARVPYGFAVHPRIPAATIAELVAHARAHPGVLNYASTGVASTSSLVFEMLKRATAIDIVHIPFKGSASAINELVSGRVDVIYNDLARLLPHADSGSLRLIAVAAGGRRSSAAPSVHTLAEQGYAELAIEPWYGIVVPAGTPADVIRKLSETLLETLRAPAVRERFDRLGYRPLESSPEQLADLIRTETKTFEALIEHKRIDPQR